ncbi:MAG: tandem-95 repeat protein, partial [Candidatus Binatia bacterium]
LTVTSTDGNGASDTDSVAITVTAVNDTPVTTVPGAQVAVEDTVLPIGGVSVNDVDGNIASVTLTVANGTLSVTAAGAAGVAGNGSGTVTITGSQADINATLASLGYQGNPNYNGADTLTVTATDSNGASSSGNVPITVTAVNDAPVNTVPGAQAATEDTPLAIPGIVVNDVEGNVTSVTLAVANGTLNVTAAGAAGVAGNGTGTVTVTGSQTDINATIASLVYQGNLDFNGADPLTVTSTDSNGASDTDIVPINVAAVNDAPANTVPGPQVVAEDSPLAIGGVSVNDVDGNLASVTVAVANGTLGVTPAGAAGVAGNGTGTITITGSQADINATLASLGYQGNPNYNGADTLTVTSTDSNGAATASNVGITVTAVNDAPVNTLPGAQAGAEDTVLAIGGISVSDPDGGPLSVTLGVANGTLQVGLAGGATITAGANGSTTLTLTGTVAQVNAALATLGFLGAPDWSGADTLTVTTTDGALVDAGNVAIAIAAVNDAPVLGANAFKIDDAGSLVLSSANLSATDVDNAAGSLAFVVGAIANGRFELAAAPGVAVTSFTQAQIQGGLVRFVHDGSGQAPSFSIYVTDGGIGIGPFAANISFTGGSGFLVTPLTPAAGGSAPASGLLPAAVAVVPTGASDAGAASFLRGPTEPPSGGADTEDAPVEPPATIVARIPGGTVLQDKVLIPDSRLPGVRIESEIIATKPLRAEIQVEPMRAEMEVLPIGDEETLDLDDEDRQRIEIVLNSVRISGLALSVGAVWWAARAAGLVASLISVTPAWRHVDPLPVLGRDDEEEEDTDLADDDKDRRDDEHRARWVLDERASSSA